MKKFACVASAFALAAVLAPAPASAWMASDTDTAIGIVGALAGAAGAAAEASHREEEARQVQVARIANAVNHDFANVLSVYAERGLKPWTPCNATHCWRNYVVNTKASGYFLAYDSSSRTNGSVVRVVCWRADANAPVPMRCNATNGDIFVLPLAKEHNIIASINNANR